MRCDPTSTLWNKTFALYPHFVFARYLFLYDGLERDEADEGIPETRGTIPEFLCTREKKMK
jgi:hypothetical protein